MSIIISLFLIGVSLSMDTFSVSLSIGTFNIAKRKILLLVVLVGTMHFLMPLLGNFLGNKIITFLKIDVNFLLGLILLFIAIQMTLELIKKEDKIFELSLINIFLLSLTVSLDSFSTGLGLSAITNNYILSGSIFSICASSFTIIGYLIGKYSSDKLGIYSQILGILILIILSITHIF